MLRDNFESFTEEEIDEWVKKIDIEREKVRKLCEGHDFLLNCPDYMRGFYIRDGLINAFNCDIDSEAKHEILNLFQIYSEKRPEIVFCKFKQYREPEKNCVIMKINTNAMVVSIDTLLDIISMFDELFDGKIHSIGVGVGDKGEVAPFELIITINTRI